MSRDNLIDQNSCDNYRVEIFKQLNENAKEINSMKGAHRLAVIISPIITSLILALAGVAFASYIKSELLTMKMELIDSQQTEPRK